MSIEENTSTEPLSPVRTSDSTYRPSANYMACRDCGEGAIVYDTDAGTSRCRSCGAYALPASMRP